MLLRPAQEDSRITKIVIHHEPAIGLHSVGAGSLMQEGSDAFARKTRLHPIDEIIFIQIIFDLAIHKIFKFIRIA